MGRRRQFYGRTGDEATIREAVAFEPQSAVADTLNQAMLRLWKVSPVYGIQLLAQIHDAILLQLPDDKYFHDKVQMVVNIIEERQTISMVIVSNTTAAV
jgi:DNA polymerase I-like protein with 3'-5' exonuclease and polymerase domains